VFENYGQQKFEETVNNPMTRVPRSRLHATDQSKEEEIYLIVRRESNGFE